MSTPAERPTVTAEPLSSSDAQMLIGRPGDRQHEATRLYERAGFARLPCFGE